MRAIHAIPTTHCTPLSESVVWVPPSAVVETLAPWRWDSDLSSWITTGNMHTAPHSYISAPLPNCWGTSARGLWYRAKKGGAPVYSYCRERSLIPLPIPNTPNPQSDGSCLLDDIFFLCANCDSWEGRICSQIRACVQTLSTQPEVRTIYASYICTQELKMWAPKWRKYWPSYRRKGWLAPKSLNFTSRTLMCLV